MVIPKPLCQCRICEEARTKGTPYARTGPSAFIHDENLLIDTPAEIAYQLNRSRIKKIDYLMFSHLDPDHVEGFRVVEQITLDFRSWHAYGDHQINLVLPEQLDAGLKDLKTIYGALIDYYEEQGFVRRIPFKDRIKIGETDITAIPVDRGTQVAFVYVFEREDKRVVYAPCDIRPFPANRKEVLNADLLVIQPGIFETGLKHGFTYPENHISRTTLYTCDQTMGLAKQINAKEVLFVHLEEYWNRGYDEYVEIEKRYDNIRFAYDGLKIMV
jgi:phosphoribosyl 1,2-cyclic phosphate phosphodiesterase